MALTVGIFFGWYIVAASVLLTGYHSAIFVYGLTAFLTPIATTAGWTYAQISLASSLRGLEVGLLDPLCFLIRSAGLSILPAMDAVARATVDLLPAGSALHDGAHGFLDEWFLGPRTHRYHVGWFIGALFLVVVGLNFFMARFWCRVICPLGGLLGIMSRWTLFGLQKDPEAVRSEVKHGIAESFRERGLDPKRNAYVVDDLADQVMEQFEKGKTPEEIDRMIRQGKIAPRTFR